jgi:tetratricopeptide (TPR) repeat protein
MLDYQMIANEFRIAASMLLLVGGMSFPGHLLAQSQPEPDSENSSGRAGAPEMLPESAAEPRPRLNPGSRNTSDSRNIRDYQQQVDQLESRYGAYHDGLSEVVLGLGLAQQQEGNHKEAILSLSRALQINRVNQGLYHVSKIPLIEQLIVSYSATGDWQAVDDSYYTLMQLYSRNYINTDVELLPGLAKLIRWHLYAFGGGLTEQPYNHLQLARELLFQSIHIIKINLGANDLRLLEPLAALVLTDYYQAAAQLEYQEQVSKASINSFRDEPGKSFDDTWNPYLNVFTQGKQHIEEMIHITQTNPAAPPRTAIDAFLLLADWHLLFKKKMTADEIYRHVWTQIMAMEDHEQQIEEIFRQPISLPHISISGTSFSDNGGKPGKGSDIASQGNDDGGQDMAGSTSKLGAIVIEFDITSSGRAVNAEVVEVDPGAKKNDIVKAKRQLKASRFRPRYENGIAVEAQKTRIRYLFEPDPEQIMAEAGNEE